MQPYTKMRFSYTKLLSGVSFIVCIKIWCIRISELISSGLEG